MEISLIRHGKSVPSRILCNALFVGSSEMNMNETTFH